MCRARRHADDGYSFIEATVSIMVLAMMALSISGLYAMGLTVQQAELDESIRVAVMRSQMEFLLSVPFAQLAGGTRTENINGSARTLTWTVAPADINGDGIAEDSAKRIALEMDGRILSTLVVQRKFGGKL